MVKFERRCCADGTFARGGLCGSSGGYAGSTCNVQVPAWEYVAIFSCPENPLFKLPGERVVDMCAPDLHEKAKDDWGYLEIYSPRRLVFFPTKAPVPQIVLQTTYPP
jgi:hypothetical protein